MRPLDELINDEEPAWPMVEEWIRTAAVELEVLPTDRSQGEAALLATQVTTRSPMGAIVYQSAGLLVDCAWLRILGAGGHPRLGRSLPGWNEGRSSGFYLVADDVVGGFFAINGGALGDDQGKIYYYAPDALRWEPCDLGYSDFVVWTMSGSLEEFYESMRWEGWRDEVCLLTGDQTMGIFPFLSVQGPPIAERHRAAVPIDETYRLQVDLQRQLDGESE